MPHFINHFACDAVAWPRDHEGEIEVWKKMVGDAVRTNFAQPDAAATRGQVHEVVRILEDRFLKAAMLLTNAEPDVLAHTALPRAHWRKIASTDPLERISKEIKRRSNVVGVFPDDASVI